MNIVVTGGAGFIGSHVVDQLVERGHRVTVVDDFNDFYPPEMKRKNVAHHKGNVKIIEADIRNSSALALAFQTGNFDTVVHLAARAGVRPSLQQPKLYTEVNVLGTLNVLETAKQYGVPKIIFGSSSSVYGVNRKIPFSESDPISNPISPYAASKLAGEALCHVYHHLYGMDIVALRFFTVYGPRQRPDLAICKFTRAIWEGRPIELFGHGETRRDYTHVEDIIQGVISCLDRKFGFEIINLGESETVKLLYLVQLIEKAVGKPALIRWLPEQPGDVPVTYADISKARNILGYQPRVKIEDGIPHFVEWFRREIKNR